MKIKTLPRVIVAHVDVGQILPLRHRILRKGLPIETAHFDADTDGTTFHFAAFLSDPPTQPNTAICCASFMLTRLEGEQAWQLRGMATDEEYQGQGIGQQLMRRAEEILVGTGVSLFWCNARVPAVRFYEKQGWQVVSEVFDVPSAGPHRKMIRRIPPRT